MTWGDLIAQWIAFSLLHPGAPGLILGVPDINLFSRCPCDQSTAAVEKLYIIDWTRQEQKRKLSKGILRVQSEQKKVIQNIVC